MEHFFFDLDGTLLPMNQRRFVEFYMPLLAARFEHRGIPPEQLAGAVWKGVEAMAFNDGSCVNEEVFWDCFERQLSIRREEVEEEVLDFYANEFNQAIQSTEPTPVADQIIKFLKQKGKKVYLATNPIFPRCATMNRIRWAGLDAQDFEEITTYVTYRYSKPNPEYFREILKRYDLRAVDCMMIGNDGRDDLAASSLGMKTYLVTACLEHGDAPAKPDHQGKDLGELYEDLRRWIEMEEICSFRIGK